MTALRMSASAFEAAMLLGSQVSSSAVNSLLKSRTTSPSCSMSCMHLHFISNRWASDRSLVAPGRRQLDTIPSCTMYFPVYSPCDGTICVTLYSKASGTGQPLALSWAARVSSRYCFVTSSGSLMDTWVSSLPWHEKAWTVDEHPGRFSSVWVASHSRVSLSV